MSISEAEQVFHCVYQKYREFQFRETKNLTQESMTDDQRKHINYISYIDLYLARIKEINDSIADPPKNKTNATPQPVDTQMVYNAKSPGPVMACFSARHPDLPDLDVMIITQRHFVETVEAITEKTFLENLSSFEPPHWLNIMCKPLYNWRLKHNYNKILKFVTISLHNELQHDPNMALQVVDDTLLFPGSEFAGLDDDGNPLMKVDESAHWDMKKEIANMRELRLARMSKEDIEEEKREKELLLKNKKNKNKEEKEEEKEEDEEDEEEEANDDDHHTLHEQTSSVIDELSPAISEATKVSLEGVKEGESDKKALESVKEEESDKKDLENSKKEPVSKSLAEVRAILGK
ncbi:uncharacterized protein SAPINGB_P004354 [Magnusiomyces paraingens]|uniref:Uncharacterized protein n=1 Tax=Magnusiomyces paraingens TaxID=2606893 RepID=A0A5E8BV36_9ASCO|nr:uncharacterized protein SAPINGB_P004354 [Saprochaete ingens]VVT54971.1 unnamed protein product [Saprochaete ingens]